ncbi:metallophosphoesterase family protein [Amorphus orientalis]|uniref:DNA repair exonuclease SbcCD nuclease subunit n=1 Tax=Amorphus orientalis TaxID=649198 RepID=A0AAE4ATN3_9HYPH|nr:DNA repair exonuclease [Amorphus orientalis]MDQ0316317.1 DNA repair exonuclease SbcCD nuclease subunit [Amorphus orientalis]
MSAFRFLHTADLHLGSPLRGLAAKDPEVAKVFAQATRGAFEDLVARAIEERVAFVVIAGDVYDGDWKDTSIGLFFARQMARLDQAGIPVFLIRGNHDAESVVTRSITLPDNVRQFSAARPETFEIDDLKVALHGRSFPDRAVPENYAVAYPDPTPGRFNIGVLHTSCDGRPPHAVYAPCSVQDLQLRGYDYWALGHVHEQEIVSREPWIVFPGNLQGRSVRECGPKGAMLVEVEDGRVGSVEPVVFDRARWESLEVDVSGVETETDALRAVEAVFEPAADRAEHRPMAVRVTLTGTTPLHAGWRGDHARIADEVQAALQRRHGDAWLEKLKLATHGPGVPAGSAASDLAQLDLAAVLAGIETEEGVRAKAAEVLAEIGRKMPAGVDDIDAPRADDLDQLLAEARDLVLGRADGG